jgi:hypothetical protein
VVGFKGIRMGVVVEAVRRGRWPKLGVGIGIGIGIEWRQYRIRPRETGKRNRIVAVLTKLSSEVRAVLRGPGAMRGGDRSRHRSDRSAACRLRQRAFSDWLYPPRDSSICHRCGSRHFSRVAFKW